MTDSATLARLKLSALASRFRGRTFMGVHKLAETAGVPTRTVHSWVQKAQGEAPGWSITRPHPDCPTSPWILVAEERTGPVNARPFSRAELWRRIEPELEQP